MKQILLIAVASLCLALSGCSDKRDKCEEYAPADVTVSWTDYNTVDRFCEYFHCHPGTLKANEGKMIKICGYSTLSYEEMLEGGMGWMYLKDDLNKSGSKVIVNLSGLGEECHKLVREVLADGNRKVYVTGLVSSDYFPENGGDIGCCDRFAEIYSRTISREEQ